MAMQRTVQTVTKIAFAILPPDCPAADRRRWTAQHRPTAIDPKATSRTLILRNKGF